MWWPSTIIFLVALFFRINYFISFLPLGENLFGRDWNNVADNSTRCEYKRSYKMLGWTFLWKSLGGSWKCEAGTYEIYFQFVLNIFLEYIDLKNASNDYIVAKFNDFASIYALLGKLLLLTALNLSVWPNTVELSSFWYIFLSFIIYYLSIE